MDKMLCSLNSQIDFPPLDNNNRFTRLSTWREDNNTNEPLEISKKQTNKKRDSGSLNSRIFMNISLQEALSREKVLNKGENNIMKVVTLKKTQIFSSTEREREQTTHLTRRSWKKTAGGGRSPARRSYKKI